MSSQPPRPPTSGPMPGGLEGPPGSHSQGSQRPQGSGPIGGPLQRGPLTGGIPTQGPVGPMPHGGPPNQRNIQRMLEENAALIKTISEYQNAGKHNETVQYQWNLHRNMMYLASVADSTRPPP